MKTAEGIRVEIHRTPGSDPALAAEERGLRRGSLAALGALPPLLVVGYFSIRRVVNAARADLIGELAIIAATLIFLAVVIVRYFRRQALRTAALPDLLWTSPTGLYPGPYDDDNAMAFVGSADFARSHVKKAIVPIVRLVLTPSSLEIVPLEGDNQALVCDLSDVETIGVTCASRRVRGVTVTRKDGRTARLLLRPDKKFVNELRQLGATITGAGANPSQSEH